MSHVSMFDPRAARAALALCLFAGACARPAIHRLTEQEYRPRPADYPITLTEGDIDIPYDEIATVKTRAFEEWEARERADAELARAAREIGGDAVIRIHREPTISEGPAYQPTYTFRAGTKLVTKYFYTGAIVRYRRDVILEERRQRQSPAPPAPPPTM